MESEYRPDIDGLRALAVMAVVIGHFSSALLPSGHLGVDVFFVISGYVVSSSLNNTGRNEGLLEFLGRFYARRIMRLLPALIACVSVTGILIAMVDPEPGTSLKTGIAALAGASNFYLLRQSMDYFSVAAGLNPFTHTWSLGVEEQFYLFLPVLVWLSLRMGSQRTQSAWLFVLSTASLFAYSVLGVLEPEMAFYLSPLRFWEFGVGALAFLTFGSSDGVKLPRLAIAVVLGLAFLLPAELGIAAVITVVALSAVLVVPGGGAALILEQRAVVYCGRVSYSLYLWHWPVLVVARWTIGVHPWTVPLLIAVTFGLAVSSYHLVERPLRHAVWPQPNSRTIFAGFVLAGATAGLMAALGSILSDRIYLGSPPPLDAGVQTLTEPYVLDGTREWAGADCVLSDNGDVGKKIDIDACTIGNFATSKRHLLVIGNSYSAAFVHSFGELYRANNEIAIIVTSSWGASVVPDEPNTSQWNLANDYYWESVVPNLIGRLQSGDIVILVDDVAQYSPEKSSLELRSKLSVLEGGLRRMSKNLAKRGIGMAMLAGLPFLREAECDPSAIQWFQKWNDGPCKFLTRAETLSRRAPLDAVLSRLRDQSILKIVDLIGLFCPGARCTAEASGTMLYRDEFSHPSNAAAKLAAPLFQAAL